MCKNSKIFISFILVLLLTLSISLPASAATPIDISEDNFTVIEVDPIDGTARAGTHLVKVSAAEIKPGLVKCTILRTCIHNQRMPDGRGILLPCKAKKRRQYFVYCKIFQRGRPAKDPLRRCRMVVNTGS